MAPRETPDCEQPAEPSRYAFLSGMGRSGTTLLDKLLCNHPRLSVLSQPFPYLFLHAKRQFLTTLGQVNCPRPLGHYFLEQRYGLDDLATFLDDFELRPRELQALFAAMADYDGQYHKPPDMLSRVAGLPGGRFLETHQRLLRVLRHRSDVSYYASKETHCEEFFPFFADQGVRCVALIRDPRDVIASFHFGQGTQYGGRRRPTLFYIRNWRKSVAIALRMERHANFHWLRYEDLVARPERQLQLITEFLGIEPLPSRCWKEGLQAQDGKPWRGNSSHAPSAIVNRESVGRFRELLPASMRRFVEVCCLPEMRLLGYPDTGQPLDAGSVLEDYREPFALERDDFPDDYSTQPLHLEQERERWRLLCDADARDERGFFLDARIRERLRAAAREE